MGSCDCKVCQELRYIESLEPSMSREAKEKIYELWERWAVADMDREYWRLKYEGNWPPREKPERRVRNES